VSEDRNKSRKPVVKPEKSDERVTTEMPDIERGPEGADGRAAEEPGSGKRPARGRKFPRWARLPIAILVFAFIVMVFVAAALELASIGKVAKGVTIDGQPVGAMTRGQALKVAEGRCKPLSQAITLSYAERDFGIDPAAIKFKPQPQAMAYAAYMKSRESILPVRLFKRLFGVSTRVNIPVVYTYDPAILDARIKAIARQVDRAPASAYISVSSGSPDVVPAKKGVTVKVKETEDAVVKALPSGNRRVSMVVEYKTAELTEKDIGKIVLIKLTGFRLYLYDRERLVDDFEVAVGMKQYPTPTGRFHITYKEKNPTWLPTSEWAKDKQGIPQPPGPDNPLGGYWMDLGGGIGIHATPFIKSLGEQASHGCIRMAPGDAERLYGAVKVGTPVFIID
jgi:lipoprotein-anchoring transpeptidase ErfK/SrfK